MTLGKKHLRDVMEIMGIEEEMVRLLPRIRSKTSIMNPWGRSLPGIFRELKLRSGQELLDIPCGEGGVSVLLAKKYRVTVTGCDVVPEYVERANCLAQKQGVGELCRFAVKDARDVVRNGKRFDILLWIAPPHIWGKPKPTIRALRKCIKEGGIILIGDAYLCRETEGFDAFETLENTTRGYTSFGDELLSFYDYKGTLWKRDYQMYREDIESAIGKARDKTDREILLRYLSKQIENEKSDSEHLGLAMWVLRGVKT